MDLEFNNGQMVQDMKDYGKITELTDKENSFM